MLFVFVLWDRNKIAKPAKIKNGSIAKLTAFQPAPAELPAQFIKPPEASEATVTPPKTTKSFKPCIFPRSSGVCEFAKRLVAPMKPKFQPMPNKIKAIEKFAKLIPDSATNPDKLSINNPEVIIFIFPNRTIRWPVKKDGINIAKTCMETMSAALFSVKPQPTTASGVDVITKFIKAYATIAQIIATSNSGVFNI